MGCALLRLVLGMEPGIECEWRSGVVAVVVEVVGLMRPRDGGGSVVSSDQRTCGWCAESVVIGYVYALNIGGAAKGLRVRGGRWERKPDLEGCGDKDGVS